jgi:hypothetical protein
MDGELAFDDAASRLRGLLRRGVADALAQGLGTLIVALRVVGDHADDG